MAQDLTLVLLACDTEKPGSWAPNFEKYTTAQCRYNPTAKGHTLNTIYCMYYSQKGKEYEWHFR
jgi:hypothetical protein